MSKDTVDNWEYRINGSEWLNAGMVKFNRHGSLMTFLNEWGVSEMLFNCGERETWEFRKVS